MRDACVEQVSNRQVTQLIFPSVVEASGWLFTVRACARGRRSASSVGTSTPRPPPLPERGGSAGPFALLELHPRSCPRNP
eukprot:scaffold123390_cov37-Tisochrysis_lutea.AAC.1